MGSRWGEGFADVVGEGALEGGVGNWQSRNRDLRIMEWRSQTTTTESITGVADPGETKQMRGFFAPLRMTRPLLCWSTVLFLPRFCASRRMTSLSGGPWEPALAEPGRGTRFRGAGTEWADGKRPTPR
jgi:hypothetical protein